MAEWRAFRPRDIPDWVLRNPAGYDPRNPAAGIHVFRQWRIQRNRYLIGIGLAERLPGGGVRLTPEAVAVLAAERAKRWPVADPTHHTYAKPDEEDRGDTR